MGMRGKGIAAAWVCAFGLVALHTRPASALTYAEWLAAVPDDGFSVQVRFVARGDGQVRSTTTVLDADNGRSGGAPVQWRVPVRPRGGLVGRLEVTATGQHGGAGGPLALTVMLVPVQRKDLVAGGCEPDVQYWGAASPRMVRPQADIRPPVYTERLSLPVGELPHPARPLILPVPSNVSRGFPHGQSMLACLCELTDASGVPLARQHVIDVFSPSSYHGGSRAAWVIGEAEADRILREQAGMGDIETQQDLPDIMAPYHEIDAVWVSGQAWSNGTVSVSLLRRLALMGLWVYGHERTVSDVASSAGLSAPQAVLMGGIGSPEQSRSGVAGGRPQRPFWTGPYHDSRGEGKDLWPETRVDLFADDDNVYLAWTLSVLGLFFVAAGIGLPVAFLKLRGAVRLRLWWIVPAGAVAAAVVGHVGGRAVLPRAPRADVTEYRCAYAGWEQVYCRQVARMLTYESVPVHIEAPARAVFLPGAQGYGGPSPVRAEHIRRAGDAAEYVAEGKGRGTVLLREIGYFAPVEPPVERAAGGTNACLRLRIPCRRMFVWHNGAFYRMPENLPAGERVILGSGIRTNKIHGLPQRVESVLQPYAVPDLQFSCAGGSCLRAELAHTHTDAGNPDPFRGSCLVVAVTDEEPGVDFLGKGLRATSRVVWIVQVPLDGEEAGHDEP